MRRGVVLAGVLLAGVTAGLLGPIRPADAAAAALAIASVAVAVGERANRRAVALSCLFWLAGADGARARDRALASPIQDWFASVAPDGRAPDVVLVRGTLLADASVSGTGVRLLVEADHIKTEGAQGRWRPLHGRLQVNVGGARAQARAADWTAGRAIEAPMVLREPQVPRNPDSPSPTWTRLRRAVNLLGTAKSGLLVETTPGTWWDEWAAGVRRHIRKATARFVAPHSRQSAAIVAAILIGDRAGLDVDVQRRLQAAGTYHVIAISGGNIAILTALCFALLRLLIRSSRAVVLTAIGVVVTYGWLVGSQPSVERAVVAACLYLGLGLGGLRPAALNMLAAVAAGLALVNPLIVIDVGAWLSFGATLGIVVGASRFQQWATAARSLAEQSSEHERPGAGRRGVRCIWRAVLGVLGATVAAELTLLPVSAAVFHRVSVLGLVLNFVAIPAMTIVQVSGLVMSGLAGWWDGGAALAGWVAHVFAVLIVGSSGAVNRAPWLTWRVPPTWPIWTVAFYAALAASLWIRGRGAARRMAVGTAVASAVIIVLAPGLEWARPGAGWLRLTMIDVGQGDSLLVQFPAGQSLLIDAGGATGGYDIGSRVVTPALWALGVRRLDWLAFTHPDLDHIGGAEGVARDLRPREIWEGVPVPPNAERTALRIDAQAHDIVWRRVVAGDTFDVGSVRVDVLHPPPPDWERQKARNEDSLVLRVCFGDVEMLLTGDAGQEFEREFPRDNPHLPLRVLKVGHHGSRTASSAPFVQAFQPDVALISAGRGNPFGHPAPDVVARYDRAGAIVFRTDRDGAAIVETNGAELDVRTMSGRQWVFTAERR